MSYTFRITDRRTSLTAQERIDTGTVAGPEDTIVDVEVGDRPDRGSWTWLANFQHAYVRASTNKRQLIASCRAKAQTAGDQALFTGGENSLVGIEITV